MSSSEFPTRCRCRRQAPTNLRCSRCNAPICPHCSVVAPIGQLCKGCVQGKSDHLHEFGAGELVRGLGASLLVAILLGWTLAAGEKFGLLLAIWGGLIHGLATSETCLRVTGHKRGWQFEAIAGGCAGAGTAIGFYLVSPESVLSTPFFYACIAISVIIAVTRLRSF